MKILRITIATAGFLLAATEGRTQISPVTIEGVVPATRVSYADLDLTSPAGRSTLDRRVSHAAAGLCLDNMRVPLEQFALQRQCYSSAMSKARIDIQQAVARASAHLALLGAIVVAAR
jgi:UrcA family protein